MFVLWQQLILLLYALYAAYAAVQGFYHTSRRKNAYGLTPQFFLLGAFVWADSMVLGFFWTIVSCVVWFFQDWLLFLLILSTFWLVRSIGETIYWFNQQFSPLNKNPVHQLPGYNWVHNDSIWFIYQIIAQCITVISILTTLYLANQWLARF